MNDGASWYEQGDRLLAARRLDDAALCFRRAEAEGADEDKCTAARWMIAMLAGDFEAAWKESDAIRERGRPDPNRFWQGESLAGKRVILRCLHGFGDAVQFLRYVPRLQALASQLIVEVAPRFVELAKRLCGRSEVITWGADAPDVPPAWDVQIEIMELPYLFRTQLQELPIAFRYLCIPELEKRDEEGRRNLRVGLMWSAGAWNAARAIPFSLVGSMLATSGCEFWSLQQEEDHGGETSNVHGLVWDERAGESLMGLVDLIARLDLVITVDTLAAHVAGALGVKTWLMLQYEADWRWMHARKNSPWYPSLELFRQPSPGDWASVAGMISERLKAQVASSVQGSAA